MTSEHFKITWKQISPQSFCLQFFMSLVPFTFSGYPNILHFNTLITPSNLHKSLNTAYVVLGCDAVQTPRKMVSALKIQTEFFHKRLVSTNKTTWRHNLQKQRRHPHRHDNRKSHTKFLTMSQTAHLLLPPKDEYFSTQLIDNVVCSCKQECLVQEQYKVLTIRIANTEFIKF